MSYTLFLSEDLVPVILYGQEAAILLAAVAHHHLPPLLKEPLDLPHPPLLVQKDQTSVQVEVSLS